MTDIPDRNSDFLDHLTHHVKEHLGDEKFGVSELAKQVNMSRSNLLRKVKHLTGSSVSIFIRKVRLNEAKKLLKKRDLTVSEIAFRVGFSSTSYFTKCFREEYGFPPGEAAKRMDIKIETSSEPEISQEALPYPTRYVLPGLILLVIAGFSIAYYFMSLPKPLPEKLLEKSIAVLPFKNDSKDSSNIYLINGLMEAIMDNLQKVKDLKVVSRTTVEKYRNKTKSIPELAQELQVNYFIEGSGQKIGDQILLSIQLIEAPNDRHIWSKRYERKMADVFQLQTEIALDMANEIEAIITPEELQRIEKQPTQNPIAYDLYLEGLGKTMEKNEKSLQEAIELFKKAIEEDNQFPHAYAYIGICYYYLEIFQPEKKYGLEINTYADKSHFDRSGTRSCIGS